MKRVEVLKLMAEGWELSLTRHGGDVSVGIQKGGAGRGGEVRTVSYTVYEAMKRRGEIVKVEEPEGKRRYWRDRYTLARKSNAASTRANNGR